MILSHDGKSPDIDPSAWVAPSATVCGDVVVGPETRIAHGASIVAEGGRIELGRRCIVLENAVVRSTSRHSTKIGDFCLVGPNAHLVGCTLEDEVFVATGSAIFHAARLGKGSEVRVNGVVHLRSHLPAGEVVPIGWVAVGDPAEPLPSSQHVEIWSRQRPLDFPKAAYGIERDEADMVAITERMAAALGTHRDDEVVG
jgi:carbonic anhydrase/acetyltransferase-like protein (isoleucine patch superfamily)